LLNIVHFVKVVKEVDQQEEAARAAHANTKDDGVLFLILILM